MILISFQKIQPQSKQTYDWTKAKKLPLLSHQSIFISQVLNIRKFDIIIIQFAGYWSLLPSIFANFFNIPVIIISHGTDRAQNYPHSTMVV